VGSNFVKTMVRLERTQETLSVVDDQIGSPTWSFDLATALVELAQSPVTGTVLHCTNDGQTSWRGFAQAIFERLGADPERVQPTTTEQFPRPAPRPAYSVLDGQGWRSAGLTPMPSWSDALHRAFAAVGDQFRSASS